MAPQQMDKLDMKLEFVKLVIADAEEEYRGADGAERLFSILETYESLLLRSKFKIETDLEDLNEMRKAVRESASLLQDMVHNEPELMRGWYHGVHPTNKAHALASLLARVMIECTTVVTEFEKKYPKLKRLLDDQGRYQLAAEEGRTN